MIKDSPAAGTRYPASAFAGDLAGLNPAAIAEPEHAAAVQCAAVSDAEPIAEAISQATGMIWRQYREMSFCSPAECVAFVPGFPVIAVRHKGKRG